MDLIFKVDEDVEKILRRGIPGVIEEDRPGDTINYIVKHYAAMAKNVELMGGVLEKIHDYSVEGESLMETLDRMRSTAEGHDQDYIDGPVDKNEHLVSMLGKIGKLEEEVNVWRARWSRIDSIVEPFRNSSDQPVEMVVHYLARQEEARRDIEGTNDDDGPLPYQWKRPESWYEARIELLESLRNDGERKLLEVVDCVRPYKGYENESLGETVKRLVQEHQKRMASPEGVDSVVPSTMQAPQPPQEKCSYPASVYDLALKMVLCDVGIAEDKGECISCPVGCGDHCQDDDSLLCESCHYAAYIAKARLMLPLL